MAMNENHENLNELLSSFYNEQEANEFKNDLNSFDKMLDDSAAPSSQMIDSIKSAVAKKLSSRKHRKYVVLRPVAAAAIVLLIAFAGLKITSRQDSITEVAISNLTYDLFDESETSQIASLTEQIEQIEDALLSVRLDEYDSYGDDSYLELEAELNEINGDFWKG
jgi:hypothetical protein